MTLRRQPGGLVMARCGRTDSHGGHWAHAIGRPCAGNVDIVTAVVCEVTYPHHSHLVVRDNMRSISDAPTCEGIPAVTAPCFCDGPWYATDPADRPDTTLAREHTSGVDGCTYVDNVR